MPFKDFSCLSLSVATLALPASAVAQTATTSTTAARTGTRYGTFGIDLTAAN